MYKYLVAIGDPDDSDAFQVFPEETYSQAADQAIFLSEGGHPCIIYERRSYWVDGGRRRKL